MIIKSTKIFKLRKLTNQGFTLVELMIALSILSLILLFSTVILMQIGELYTKGVNASSLQNTNRNVASDISSNLQFSGSTPTEATSVTKNGETINAICIGNVRYSYILNQEDGSSAYLPDVLWRDHIKNTDSACVPLNVTINPVIADTYSADAASGSPSGGYEMVPQHMRLTKFDINQSSTVADIYSVDVWMAFGADDQIDSSGGNFYCKGGTGEQFCGVSAISSTVEGRIY